MIRLWKVRFLHSKYVHAFQQSKDHPEEYWKRQASEVSWFNFPTKILDSSRPPYYRWFTDGKINITHNLLDRHLENNRGKQIAYHLESPITGTPSSDITIEQLHKRVEKLADSLVRNFKVKKGDTVIIYMPMIIESVIAQLACARIGAIHSVVFGGFSARQLAIRIKDCSPKIVLCATGGKQPNRVINYEQIVLQACKLSEREDIPVIIYERKSVQPRQKSLSLKNFHDFLEIQQAGTSFSPVQLQSNHPLYIIFTSGTTGAPKGIYRDHGGTSVILSHAMKYIFNLHHNDGLFCTSDIGWVLGHSFITYGPLMRGVRSVLYQGKPIGTPDAGQYWRIVQKCKINHLYTSPTAVRSIRKEDPQGQFIKPQMIKDLQGLTLVGQRCDIQTFKWVQKHFQNSFINDSYWQTETGSPILSNFQGFQGFPPKPGSACKPIPGYFVKVLNEAGQQCKPNETGQICMEIPTPPSFMLSLWNGDKAFVEKYFTKFTERYYETGDSGYYDEDGYFYIMSRVDDVINTAGHRLSTGQMEEVLMKHPSIAEAIVIGVKDEVKGEIPAGFVTIKTNKKIQSKQKLQKQLITLIRHDIGAVASFKICFIVQRLPKTRSGKYLRKIVRKMYNGEQYVIPSTIEDIEVAHELQDFIKNIPNK